MAAKLAAQIQQDAAFFDSMVHLIPQSYYSQQQETDSKFTHSKGEKGAPRQSLKESSKQGLKAKAKAFDPKNYASVLSKPKQAEPSDDDDDEEMDDGEDDENEDDESDEDQQPAKRAAGKASASVAGKHSAAAASPSLSSTSAAVAPSALSASSSSSLPAPPLSSLSADVGMDQLRQRLHERIHGLSNQRKPGEHPFAKKRHKPDPAEKKKRQRNEDRPSSHKGTAKPLQPRDAPSAPSSAKKQKTGASASPSSSASPKLSSSASAATAPALRASDIADSNDFQFASLKPLALPTAKTGSFSLQGKQQRRKSKGDDVLLKEVESFESKVSSLRAAGAKEDAHELESARAMQNALLRASGVRVKDDKKLLKKSLKRDEKKKDKSRQEWAERTAAAKSTQDAFHKDKIERASKKQKGDRSKYHAPETAESRGAKSGGKSGTDKGNEKAAAKGGRAGFEGKAGPKKFLN